MKVRKNFDLCYYFYRDLKEWGCRKPPRVGTKRIISTCHMKDLAFLSPKYFVILALTLFMSLLFKATAIAENPSVDEAGVLNLRFTGGPTGKVCPLQTYTFNVAANLAGRFQWRIRQNGTWYPVGNNQVLPLCLVIHLVTLFCRGVEPSP